MSYVRYEEPDGSRESNIFMFHGKITMKAIYRG